MLGERREVYFKELERTGSKSHAARISGLSRYAAFRLALCDPAFSDREEIALRAAQNWFESYFLKVR